MDSLPPSPIAKPTLQSNIVTLWSKFKHFRITSFSTRKHLSRPQMGTHLTTDAFPTSAFPMGMGSPALLSGSSSTMMVWHLDLQTPMAPALHPTSPTYMWRLTISTMMKGKQNPHFLSQHGSAFSWWALLLISSSYTMPSLPMMTGGSPMRCTITVTLTPSTPTFASSLNIFKSSSMLSNKLDTVQQARSSCESCLQLVCMAEQVEALKNIPCKPQASHSTWKHKSSGHGRPN